MLTRDENGSAIVACIKKKGWFICAIIYKLAFDQWSPPHVQTWFHSVK